VSERCVGVVVMAYGTPRTPSDIEAYYTDIRRGRPPTTEQLAELTARYEAIGGVSPLARITEAQAAAIASCLEEIEPGRYEVSIGLKHATPRIEDAVGTVADDNVERIVGVVLAPHHSQMSIGQYLGRAGSTAAERGLPFAGVESWATEPALIDHLAADVGRRLGTMPSNTKVVFTAHSLPRRVLDVGDRYPDELRATADAVATRAGLGPWSQWSVAWQSAGRTPEPWIGPDILAVIDDLATAEHADGVLVCPCGFTADHLEVLYDLDIEARGRAERQGLVFQRTTSINDDPAVMSALAHRVHALATDR